MANTKISQLEIANIVRGNDFLVVDNTEVTRRAIVNSLSSIFATNTVAQSISSSLFIGISGTISTEVANQLSSYTDDWNNIYTITNANSANWNSTYTTTNTNSANWDITGFQTLTANISGGSFIPVVQGNIRYKTPFNNLLNLPYINIQGSTYTLAVSDVNYYIRKSHTNGHVILINYNDSFEAGMVFIIRNVGVGTLTLTSTQLVSLNFDSTINGNVLDPNTTTQLYCLGNNEWDII